MEQEYHVLELTISCESTYLRLLVGPNSMGESYSALYPSWGFVTTSDSISLNWRIKINDESLILIGPESWMADGFWERYYDGEPKARKIFEIELNKILDGQ
ncbi:hypothetical protein LO763_20240 [Glycomyces sp. A-F 0318]|uniref:hypothetical protein n=1 Tax=Glycomyces amatae TaxID=2881355 RepID=UPI001E39FE3B|nr:hypothetical protein [Glycomyces amatae]MCD0445944.1 hypothetical protein [Glycomyces amatae]